MSDVTEIDLGHGVRQLQMGEPDDGNPLTEASTAEFMDVLDRVAAAPDAKVILLTGGREVFSRGASLGSLRRLATGETELKRHYEWAHPLRLLECPLPIVAAVEGHAVGGGLMLALCCDMVVACEASRYGLNFTSLGFTPGMGTTRLIPALVGHGLAMEMILTGKYYKGRELVNRGLFNAVLPRDKVHGAAVDLAHRIAERPKHVIEMIKRSLVDVRLRAFREAALQEPLMQRICFDHPETLSMIEANYLT